MSLKIIKAGIQDTVQDKGRYGFQQLGINPSGAMDKYAMQVANILAGNDRGEAVIEMHFPAAVFMFSCPALIAMAGADFSASINGEPIPHLHPVVVYKNDVLHFHKPQYGARTYLAIHGGLGIKKWMNSYSTHLKAAAGGYLGRNFQKEEEIPLRQSFSFKPGKGNFIVLPWRADTNWTNESKEIFLLPGNEWDRLSTESKENFMMTSFVVTRQSDRMGYRLSNIPLRCLTNEEVVSSGVSFGTIQLLPDGGLIILMADHQTTGGYPRVAHVISAHHSRLAQLKAGDRIEFRFTSQAIAEELWIKQQQHLLQLQNACTFRLQEYFHGH
ncbi:MAG: biotin-dependent carboxyltransferase family protein [Chitinophagaceae bacterium]